ncbi:MAG TPA: pitrilysin family protein, partial [Vicinamibacterales bacterium]
MAVDRSRLPSLGADPAFVFPEIRRNTLANGLKVWTVEHRAVPLVSFLVLLPAGAAADPADRPGLAAVTSDLLDEGCGDLNAIDVHEALGRMGAHLDTEIGSDATLLTLTSLSRSATRAVSLLAQMVMDPRLEQRDFDRVRELRLNRLVQLRDMPPGLAERAFAKLLYPNHPYGHLPIGTEGSLRAMTLREVVGFHRQVYAPSRVTVIAAGDAPHEELASLVEQAFGGWLAAPELRELGDPQDLPRPPVPSGRLALVH